MSVKIQNLFFSYPEKPIFTNLTIEFKKGVFYSLSAPSGYGKTTLLRLICGLEKADAGTISVSGKIAYIFQEDRLFPSLTVLENAKLASSSKLDEEDVLKTLGIFDCRFSYPSEISGGQRRRVAIARALLSDFDILLLDEPFTGLDEQTKENTITLIEKICHGKTIILSTHNADEKEFCQEHIMLK